jgi:hypothetical protein
MQESRIPAVKAARERYAAKERLERANYGGTRENPRRTNDRE